MSVVYSPHYNMGFPGLDRLHPFDVSKFARAWKLLQLDLGPKLAAWHVDVDRPVTDEELLAVHTPEHLARLRDPHEIAKAFEVQAAAVIPYTLLNSGFLEPMRWAVRGSVLAAQQALLHGVAINLGGGFHHAKPDRAEGFCLFSDIALIVHQLRQMKALTETSRIVYIDLDAHQGNGVCHQFLDDMRFFAFDMYNRDVYPASDRIAIDRIDCPVPLEIGCTGSVYFEKLTSLLPGFLNSVTRSGEAGLAIYVAGTDVVAGDDLGLLNLSADQVLERDLYVFEQLRSRGVPTVMLLGGGYTTGSHRLVATSVGAILRRFRQ